MPSFSAYSRRTLEEVDERLRSLAYSLIKDIDFAVRDGRRTIEQQRRYVDAGLSMTMDSQHLIGHAVHFIPWPVDWENTKRFYYFGGYALSRAQVLRIPVRWGGDWDRDHDLDDQKFFDLIHFEIPKGTPDII